MSTSSVARSGRKERAVRDVRAILLRAPIQTDTVLLGSTCDVNCRRGRDFGSVCIMKVYGRRGGLVTHPRAMIEVSQSLVDHTRVISGGAELEVSFSLSSRYTLGPRTPYGSRWYVDW